MFSNNHADPIKFRSIWIRSYKEKLDLSSYVTNSSTKKEETLIHQNLPKKPSLVNSKSDVDKLDIDRLKTVSINSNN